MFWDGDRWLPEEPATPTPQRRGLIAGSIGTVAFAALLAVTLLPLGSSSASALTGKTVHDRWEAVGDAATVQDSSRRITYKRGWTVRMHSGYLDGRVRASDRAGAKASLEFTGSAIAWVGPVGPTRGKATVYLDGKLVATVSTYARSYKPSALLFQHAWQEAGTHRITIRVKGTKGHPTVAVDAFVVQKTGDAGELSVASTRGRGKVKSNAAPKPPAAAPVDPSPTAEPTPAEPTPAEPTPADPTPTDDPQPTDPPADPPATPAAPAATDEPASPAPTPTPTAKPTATPAPTPTPTAKPTATPTPTPAPARKSVRVTSIPALLSTLADNTVDEIVVANGTYQVSPAGQLKANSLWIGRDPIAKRTRPITVRAETIGGVTFDGSGATGAFGALSFQDGAHDQTWDGFRFTNMKAEYTGIIEVGGYLPRRTPYNITIRNMTITASCTGRAVTASGSTWDHGVYIAHAASVGPHDIRLENITVDGRGNLASAVHFDHGDAANPAAWNVTVRNLRVTDTQQAIILWSEGLRNIVFDGADITGAKAHAVRFESSRASGIVFKNITSTDSGRSGYYSSMGSNPPGVTLTNNSFD